MAVKGVACESCGQKRGHKPNCVHAAKCPECGYTNGHAGNCPHAYTQQRERETADEAKKNRQERTLVDGEEAVVLNGKTGAPMSEQELIVVPIEELLDTLTTQMAIRARYETQREFWAKKVKTANDSIGKVVQALSDRGHAKDNLLERLEAELPIK